MKKLLLLAALTLPTASFAENVVVTAPRLDPEPAAGVAVGKPADPGDRQPQHCGSGGCREGGGGAGSKFTPREPTNAQLAEMAIAQIGDLVTTLSAKEAWAYLKVTVTTPAGLKVEVELELGYGKINVKSRKNIPK